MDQIFDRLSFLMRSLAGSRTQTRRDRYESTDPDYVQAMEELEAFLSGRANSTAYSTSHAPPPEPLDEQLIRDFRNLECSPDDSLDTIKRSYKRLLRRYHPDRHADNPEKQRIATEITKELNAAFHRVEMHKRRSPDHS